MHLTYPLSGEFDAKGQLRVLNWNGQALMGKNAVCRMAIWVDEAVWWFDDETWQFASDEAGDLRGRNERIGISLLLRTDFSEDEPLLTRTLTFANLEDRDRHIKLFFGHEFSLEGGHSNTAYYDPKGHLMIHHGKKVFVVLDAKTEQGIPFDDFNVGVRGEGGGRGAYLTVVSGELARNPVEHGPVDTLLGLTMLLRASRTKLTNSATLTLSVGWDLQSALETLGNMD